jgi:hypothetical protein
MNTSTTKTKKNFLSPFVAMALFIAAKVGYVVWVHELYRTEQISEAQKLRYLASPSDLAVDVLAGKFKNQNEIEERWAEYEIILPAALPEKT